MSDTDGFIDEVTEEVRRDRLYGYLRRYGWIGVVFVLAVVGGTAWQSWQSDQSRAAAEELGDAILSSINTASATERASVLDAMVVQNPQADAVRRFLQSAADLEAGDVEAARLALISIEENQSLPLIYRQIASFKSLTMAEDVLDADARRQGFQQLAVAGNPLRLLAEEQIALVDVELGQTERALERFQAIISDAEATRPLQDRAVQVMVALGGEPDLSALIEGLETR